MSKYPNCVSENDWRPTLPIRPPGVQRTFATSGGGSTPVVPCWDLHDTRDERIADSRVPVCTKGVSLTKQPLEQSCDSDGRSGAHATAKLPSLAGVLIQSCRPDEAMPLPRPGSNRRRHHRMAMNLYTIGFTKKSADRFFGLLRGFHAERLIDIRLNNVSQLAGFAKHNDLEFFLREICGIDCTHRCDLAPTQKMLDRFKTRRDIAWAAYESQFLELITTRRIEETVSRELIDNSVLQCSEQSPARCHRRLVAEYLAERCGGDRVTPRVSQGPDSTGNQCHEWIDLLCRLAEQRHRRNRTTRTTLLRF
jgi:hypothetical protein